MTRTTLHMALSTLLLSGMIMISDGAMAQSRSGRSTQRTERRSNVSSERSSSSSRQSGSAATVTRSSGSSDRGSSAVRRDNNRNEASNWPKVTGNNTSGNSSMSGSDSRNRRGSDSRSSSMRNSYGDRTTVSGDNRPDNNNRPGGNVGNGSRPDNNNRPGGNVGSGSRPGGNNSRPGGNVGNGNRPGGNNSRPGGNAGVGNRPGGNNSRPGGGFHIGDARPGAPGHAPAPSHHGVITHRPSSWHAPVAPPFRSFRPVHHHIFRPVPPPGYRPWHRAPIISGILGLTFGTAYYTSLDYLFTRGYEIDGYYDGVVYLRNIQELSCFWPDVMLNYGTNQMLASAEFHYSTSYDDLGRFNRLYGDLCTRYGQPVTYVEDSDGIRSTWYGGNARGFVSLEYYYSRDRYYTTLSYGN
ncbi:MAG: hypothetical protein ACI308_02730 [Muribaculaceae bacterium]